MVSEQRHLNMMAIHSKDTRPEMLVRRYLWSRGFRYRLNHPRLPGKPDIVLRKYKTCIFVNGCFWHGHNVERISDSHKTSLKSSDCCKIPKSNIQFWVNKITRNQERDKEVQRKLASMGWHSITVWECDLKPDRRTGTLDSLAFTLNHIYLENHKVRQYSLPEENTCSMVAEDVTE